MASCYWSKLCLYVTYYRRLRCKYVLDARPSKVIKYVWIIDMPRPLVICQRIVEYEIDTREAPYPCFLPQQAT